MIGLHHPDRALSLVPAGAGSGSERAHIEEFRKTFAGDCATNSEEGHGPRW